MMTTRNEITPRNCCNDDAALVIERAVDFDRRRHMRCGTCQHEWDVTDEWVDRFHQGFEQCPGCGTDCQSEDRPDFWTVQDDPAHDDSTVIETYWYHTSTHSTWPDRSFDPSAGLTDVTKQRMQQIGDGEALERWAKGQRTKALHVGTYESAIENMFRRMRDQGGSGDQFYLYRVRLSRDAVIEPGVHREPTNWVGDAQLSEVSATPGVNTFRYVNTHEDPSSVSLAVTFQAIEAVQGIPVPLPVDPADPWVTAATARLIEAPTLPSPEPKTALEKFRGRMPSALSNDARRVEREVADTLPLRIRDRFYMRFDEGSLTTSPRSFPLKLAGLAQLVHDPAAALRLLDLESWRTV